MGLLLPFTEKETEAQDTQHGAETGPGLGSPPGDSEVSEGRGPSTQQGSRLLPQPCGPAAPPSIPLLYDLFYEHGLAASTLPWEPAWRGLLAA